MASGRRKSGDENIRSLTRTSGGKSYSISLPIAVVRAFDGFRECLEKKGKEI
jgi:hypothetical protein